VGGFVHAGADATRLPHRTAVIAAYAGAALVAVVGCASPDLFYGPGARGPGPLFLPMAAVCIAGPIVVIVWLGLSAIAVTGLERRRRAALAASCGITSIAGGGVIGLRILGWGDVRMAAPLLLVSVALAAYAVVSGERGRAREVVVQGLAYALFTAAASAVGLTVFYRLLPSLAPDAGRSVAWLVFVTFFAALPLDPLRMVLVERAGRWLFRNPIGVRDLAEQIERSEVRADHAERLAEIGRLSSAVAHEIRNPLGVIAAQAKLLEKQGAKPETVAAMRGQIERAKTFLDDLLRYSRPRPLEVREIEVLSALKMAANNVRLGLGEEAPRIEVTIRPGGAALLIEGDRGAFGDVAAVLAHNAAVASLGLPGGLVRITASLEAGGVVVRVEDDGPGVPAEIEATLFQPFVTGRGRDAKHPGTGLGLAIAARWVERHGGSIRYEKRAEGGARFVVRWPLVPEPDASLGEADGGV
jgi:signal transduction histidine kinase